MMRVMKRSIGDNMIPKDWAFERGLDLVKKSGFDGIELWLGDVPWFQMTTTDAEVRELRRKVENAGLVVSNVSTGLHWASPLSAPHPRGRAQPARVLAIPERREQSRGRHPPRRRQHPRHRLCGAVDRDARTENHTHSSQRRPEAPWALGRPERVHESVSGRQQLARDPRCADK